MAQRNPRYSPQNPTTQTSLIPPIPPPSNNNYNLYGYPLRRPNPPDLQMLGNSLSSFNLSPVPSLLFESDDLGEGLLRYQQHQYQPNVNLGSYRYQNGDQIGCGVGPCNPTLGPEGYMLNYPPSVSAARALYGYDHRLASGMPEFGYLYPKKLSRSYYQDSQFQSPIQRPNQSTIHNLLPQELNLVTLNDLKGRIVTFAKDHNLCRILQDKFLDPNQEEIEMVLSEVLGQIGVLMKNQFGNNLVQKLIALCSEEQRTRIIRFFTNNPYQLVSTCLNQHGIRGILKLMESLSCPQQVSLLMSVISRVAAALANDANGHHLIEHCLKNFPTEVNMYLLNEIADNCFSVATDRNGCCVMQYCVDKSLGEPRKRIVSEIVVNALYLAEDPFGNYVLQHILGLKEPNITANLLRQLEGNYMSLSCNKFGSNVVEKCLLESGVEESTRIIMELVTSPDASMILVDPYGNFVVQKALGVSKGRALKFLLDLVRANVSSMQSNLYGKKVLVFLEKRKIQLF